MNTNFTKINVEKLKFMLEDNICILQKSWEKLGAKLEINTNI